MALINCPECSKEVSDQAKICPHCGYNLEKHRAKQQTKKRLKFFIFLALAVIFLGPCVPIILSPVLYKKQDQPTRLKKQKEAIKNIKQTINNMPGLADDADAIVKEHIQVGMIREIKKEGDKVHVYIDKNNMAYGSILSLDVKDHVPIVPASVIYYQAKKEGEDPEKIEVVFVDYTSKKPLFSYKLSDKDKVRTKK